MSGEVHMNAAGDHVRVDERVQIGSSRLVGNFAVAGEDPLAIPIAANADGGSVRVELQADCFAGAWTGHLDGADLVVTDDDLNQAVAGYLQVRDPIDTHPGSAVLPSRVWRSNPGP